MNEREIAEQVARITTENARLLQRLADTERRFRRISRGVLRLQEEERGRISRDLHDGVGQSLTALKIQLELLEQEAGKRRSSLAARVRAARELAEVCLSEVRQIAHLLRPQMLDELGLVPTLRWLARTMRARTGVDVRLEHRGDEERLDSDIETLVYRFVQEALTNVARHAGTDAARVFIDRLPDRLFVRVEDDGAGFAAEEMLNASEEETGFGVRAMRERVHFFHGRFHLESAPGAGTRVEAEIPLPSGKSHAT